MGDIRISDIRGRYTQAGNLSGYEVEMQHDGLHEHKIVSAKEEYILQNKIEIQCRRWDEKWEKIVAKRRQEAAKEANLQHAEEATAEAIAALETVENLLLHTLDIDDTVDWNSLKDRSRFTLEPTPKYPFVNYGQYGKPNSAKYESLPPKPSEEDAAFQPHLSFFDKLLKSRREKREAEARERYEAEVSEWQSTCAQIEKQNTDRKQKFETQKKKWEDKEARYMRNQEIANARVDQLQSAYSNADPDAIKEYCELVLNNSVYPDTFPKTFDLDYNPESKMLVVEYDLPSIESFPTLKEVRFISSRNELKEAHINESQINKQFDLACYKIVLRTIHELFEADTINALDSISINGWVNALNKATGKKQNSCILSIQVKKTEFLEVDLKHIDPKACFKNFKGVGSAKLSGLTPVKPLIVIDRDDSRITAERAVADGLDSSTNLAAMDWEDFEHLVREMFAKEFAVSGGEVKVTQASRDGGVDAIAFDPDPIRGGKIVIQAKRYTNTVDVSAVRDLYGTVVNEGATKGILVTTADYGPDAYRFASDKPLTLLSGSNLLHLLEKHGYSARIDLSEAKKILADK